MADPTQVLSAAAACLAAALAGINLYVSGRRERMRWSRDALVEVFVSFLSISFDRTSMCRSLVRRRLGEAPPEELEALTERILDLHWDHNTALTRLRVLASDRVVEAAVALHAEDDAFVDLAERTKRELGEEDLEAVRAARDRFIAAAKKNLGISLLGRLPPTIAATSQANTCPVVPRSRLPGRSSG